MRTPARGQPAGQVGEPPGGHEVHPRLQGAGHRLRGAVDRLEGGAEHLVQQARLEVSRRQRLHAERGVGVASNSSCERAIMASVAHAVWTASPGHCPSTSSTTCTCHRAARGRGRAGQVAHQLHEGGRVVGPRRPDVVHLLVDLDPARPPPRRTERHRGLRDRWRKRSNAPAGAGNLLDPREVQGSRKRRMPVTWARSPAVDVEPAASTGVIASGADHGRSPSRQIRQGEADARDPGRSLPSSGRTWWSRRPRREELRPGTRSRSPRGSS